MQFNELVDRLTDVGNKSSSDEYKNMVRCLHEGRRSKRKETSAKMTKIRMYVSALMGGSIKTKTEHEDQLEEELEYQGADLDQPVSHMDINDTKRRLKTHEFDRLRDCGLGGKFEAVEFVNVFEPQCQEMIALRDAHNTWLTEKSTKKKTTSNE